MATEYFTTRADTKVYNLLGTEVSNIRISGTIVKIVVGVQSHPRGECWLISSPANGYVLKSRIGVREIAEPPPPPPPSTGAAIILLYSHAGDENPRRFVEVE